VTTAKPGRLRLAELTSGIGAVILGVGIGVILADRMAGLGPAILAIAITLHAWGMVDKRRQERRQGGAEPWWSAALYLACWVGLAGMLAWTVIRP
jgi:hypothetical protein